MCRKYVTLAIIVRSKLSLAEPCKKENAKILHRGVCLHRVCVRGYAMSLTFIFSAIRAAGYVRVASGLDFRLLLGLVVSVFIFWVG